MNLFADAAALKASGYLFRIVDNGGETHDRISVVTCDGDVMLCSETTICANVENANVQRDADDVEAGVSRDLRWIDLDPYLQRAIIANLNTGFADWIAAAPAFATRDECPDWDGTWKPNDPDPAPIYVNGDGYSVRDDERDEGEPDVYPTYADAVRRILPNDHDLSGPEFFTTVDLWDETDGRRPYWDREAEPPVIDEGSEYARAVIIHEIADASVPEGFRTERVAWFANNEDAENYIAAVLEESDPDGVHEGHYTIDDLDHEDAPTRRD